MDVKKALLGLALALSLSFGSVVIAADYDKGLKAAHSGDFKTALEEWAPLAEQGIASAQYSLGFMYQNGQGVLQNYKAVVKWYTLAAEQGFARAQHNLGFMYDNGQGVLQNYKTAVKWYTVAAEQGFAGAQNNLGLMYENGQGVLIDAKRAYMWFDIGAFNDSGLGDENRIRIAKIMTPVQIEKAQDMASRCLKSNYTDC